jgi:hypothetical protein
MLSEVAWDRHQTLAKLGEIIEFNLFKEGAELFIAITN